MKKQSILFIAAILCCVSVTAQQNPLQPVQSKWETVGQNKELNYYNKDYCDYYLRSTPL